MSSRTRALVFGFFFSVVALVVSGDTAETKSAAESNVTLEETHAFIRKMLLKQEILHYKKEVFVGAFCYFDYEIIDYNGAGCVMSWTRIRKLWGDSNAYTSAMGKSNGKHTHD